MNAIQKTLTALLLLTLPAFCSGAVSIKEASAPWSAEQAQRLPKALTPEVLKEIQAGYGAAAASGLAEKKEKVSALVGRFKACALKDEDVKTAEKYFIPEFRDQVRYFAQRGCAVAAETITRRAAPARSAALTNLEKFSASGSLATYNGAAKFFDGSAAAGAPAVSAGARGAGAGSRPAAAAMAAPARKPLSSMVPVLAADKKISLTVQRPENLGEDGLVHQGMKYWNDLREKNWEDCKNRDLKGGARAKALGKAAAGAVFEGLLTYSNLMQVETAAARLGWDAGSGAGAGVIAADSAKLIFHSGVCFLTLAPIPLLKVAKAALAGEAWAIATMTAMAAGPANRYVLHVAD